LTPEEVSGNKHIRLIVGLKWELSGEEVFLLQPFERDWGDWKAGGSGQTLTKEFIIINLQGYDLSNFPGVC